MAVLPLCVLLPKLLDSNRLARNELSAVALHFIPTTKSL
ncbi:hypothetical protein F383_30435 [Gossypium arboreum]|uniref:Uncharacterized protein n=1 Tax=Gossypium arboreum TaxID=29729 RepID=A0A0B0MXI8_GOSAR|nr:hypothetical protein F383_30435 [Gossypium arboreum]